MSSPDAVHFSIENFNEDFNMLTIVPGSDILELKFVHPEGHKINHVLNEFKEVEFLPSVRIKVYA